jgi:N-glycosylase/DNA lyase
MPLKEYFTFKINSCKRTLMKIDELMTTYNSIKGEIKGKLKGFEDVFNEPDEDIFLELCYCMLAAGTSALLALNTVEKIKGVVFNADVKEMQIALKRSGYRFHTVRAGYIVTTREYLTNDCGFQIKKKIGSFSDKTLLREYFAGNKGIKGLAYKSASHFLRNIGIKGYAILDKHVINSLFELGAVKSGKMPANKKSYLEIERKMKSFANKIGVDFDELDLLLWYSKTGKIIK